MELTKGVKIAPSVLACDFLHLEADLERAKNADLLHIDIMDGHFVPPISFGEEVFKSIKAASPLFMDVHLMVTNPRVRALSFIEAGADSVTFHIEAEDKPQELIDLIRKNGVMAGVAISPPTDISKLQGLDVDLILVMSVNPGFGGQKFIPESYERIKAIRKMYPNTLISVDGGITDSTIPSDVDILVAGSYLFKAADFDENIAKLRQLAR